MKKIPFRDEVITLDKKEVQSVYRDFRGLDSLRVAQTVGFVASKEYEDERAQCDGVKLNTLWVCEKWSEEAVNFARKKMGLPLLADVSSALMRSLKIPQDIAVNVVPGNLLLNEGITELIDLIANTEGPAADLWNNANANIGVGSDATAASAAQTGLIDGTPTYKGMNGGYPARTNQTCDWQSDFLTGEANEAWEEWSISNTNSNSGDNLNRRVQSLGTKATGVWTLTGSITFS